MQLSPNFRLRKKFAQENPRARRCNAPGCLRAFKNSSGLTQHHNSAHPGYIPDSEPTVLTPSAPTVPIPQAYYASEEEMMADESWRGRWTAQNSDVGDENQCADWRSHRTSSSDEPQTSKEDGGDESSNSQDNHAGPSRSRRATVEDVEDEDDISSAGSSNTRSKTTRTYHPLLNGKFAFLSPNLGTQTSYS